MKSALRLAMKGAGRTSPNPMVGAVIVAEGHKVGEGYHAVAGGPHAEINAIRQAGSAARGATLYVTLEPCCHTNKRTPPCVPEIVSAGLRRVVVAMTDPNPEVRGRGIRRLRQAGILLDVGCLETEAKRLNEGYVHWIQTGKPWVILKSAMTLDGKIATPTGESKWITGEEARRHVHRTRREVDAILVGIGTVLEDNPQLTARHESGVDDAQPLRIILDSRLRIPSTAHVLHMTRPADVLIATTSLASQSKVQQFRKAGVTVWVLPQRARKVSLVVLLKRLGAKGIVRLLVEGGGTVNHHMMQMRLVNRVMLYVAPMLLGGDTAHALLTGPSPAHLSQAVRLENVERSSLGRDMLVTGIPRYPTRHR